jgi:hypothetical protein
VFCPNCGTQNESAATPCTKCGFKLSGISVPKFRGTMMLNSDQTVQELIDEHKRKQAREAGQDPSAPAPGVAPPGVPAPASPSVAPLSGLPGAPKSVLQPPRAAAGASKRRMGGTMLGVAPQVGGLAPPPAETSPPAVAAAPSRFPMPAAPSDAYTPPMPLTQVAPERSTGGLAGTLAMPVATPAATEPEREPAPPVEPVRTQPLAAVAPLSQEEAEDEEEEADEEPMPSPAPRIVEADEPLPRRIQATAPLEAQPLLGPDSGTLDSDPKPRARTLRPLEIVLIVATCGLYGIVLLLKPRKDTDEV